VLVIDAVVRGMERHWRGSEERTCTATLTSVRTTGSPCHRGIELVNLPFEANICLLDFPKALACLLNRFRLDGDREMIIIRRSSFLDGCQQPGPKSGLPLSNIERAALILVSYCSTDRFHQSSHHIEAV
jgi:hypothetical protein